MQEEKVYFIIDTQQDFTPISEIDWDTIAEQIEILKKLDAMVDTHKNPLTFEPHCSTLGFYRR